MGAKQPRAVKKGVSAGLAADSAVLRAGPAPVVVCESKLEPAVVDAGGATGTGDAPTVAVSAPLRVVPLAHGPDRPPPPKKSRPRKKGLALLPLEGADVFRQGDWNNIEAFASTRMPMFSVAWATLKGYESCWKHWVSFQYYAQLDIFVEVSSPAVSYTHLTMPTNREV